jgi:hypothetical protein
MCIIVTIWLNYKIFKDISGWTPCYWIMSTSTTSNQNISYGLRSPEVFIFLTFKKSLFICEKNNEILPDQLKNEEMNQCCGFEMFIREKKIFHPRSRIRIFSIADPWSVSKNLTQKIVSKLTEIWSWLFIPDPGSWFFTHPGSRIQGSKRHRIPDPGVKNAPPDPGSRGQNAPPDPGSRGQKGTGSRIRICNIELNTGELEQVKRMVSNISITEDDYWRYCTGNTWLITHSFRFVHGQWPLGGIHSQTKSRAQSLDSIEIFKPQVEILDFFFWL